MMVIDDIRADARSALPFPAPRLEQAVVFNIVEVARYLAERAFPYKLTPHDLPNIAPLAPSMWFEWREEPDDIPAQTDIGALLSVEYDLADPAQRAEFEDVHAAAGEPWPDWIAEVRWLMDLWVCGRVGETIQGRRRPISLAVQPSGALRGLHSDEDIMDDEEGNVHVLWIGRALLTVLTSVCFAHCKGTVLTDHQQPRQQRRAAARASRPPLVSYKTIDIAPLTRVLREEGQIEKTGLKKALHICRGHFAHYSPDHPLFGKYTGTFFRPMHVRGTREAGLALKDYRVLGPQHAS